MIEARLPAYPLITIDPLFSIWSPSDNLYDAPTEMWTGAEKPINGNIVIDGDAKRFMGVSGAKEIIPQTACKLSMTATRYVFEDAKVRLSVTFTQPFLPSDLALAACPATYIDVECASLDGKKHDVQVIFDYSEKLVYDQAKKLTWSGYLPYPQGKIGYVGRLIQKSLTTSGDKKEIDWGWMYLAGGSEILVAGAGAVRRFYKRHKLRERKSYKKSLISYYTCEVTPEAPASYFNVLAYDDIHSINYFGSYKKGYWTKNYYNIVNVIQELTTEHDAILARLAAFDAENEKKVLARYSESYLTVLIAAYRQTFAAHKMALDGDNLLFFSKECSSNGCMATVDVSYPAVPLFLYYAPSLVKSMLVPVFDFARMRIWPFDFAPHDVGTYPFATGQAYGARNRWRVRSSYFAFIRRQIYMRSDRRKIYSLSSQMPVEECGNMLIMTAAYYRETKDLQFVKENADLLAGWAEYLVKTGIVLETQLCTDDFAGHSEKNVNLAIKGIIGIAAWGKLLNELQPGEGDAFLKTAAEYAKELEILSSVGDHATLKIDDRKSWSMKYNLVWDVLFETNLFSKEYIQKETAFYKKKMNRYGIPLDSRASYTKGDWLMWAATLANDPQAVNEAADALVRMLAETKDRRPFSDYFDTITAENKGFWHRSVLGALWLPMYFARDNEKLGIRNL